MVNLVVCSDGTWNTPEDSDGGVPTPTNVVKIHGAVDAVDDDGSEQEKYYHSGVGTDGGIISRIAGGGIGAGLDGNIKSAYKWLAEHYRPGDNIFLFGFSRGAYTVRSLGGLIGACGLLDLSAHNLSSDTLWDRVEKVFANYRLAPNKRRSLKHLNFHNAGKGQNGAGKTRIHFMGVWDTVGALGIPDDLALLNLIDDPTEQSFHDTDLSPLVKTARHAMAIDERRESFTPTMWTKYRENADVKQLWFCGVHSDVGGGYVETGLSDIALRWMIDEAADKGLKFRPGAVDQIDGNPHGVLHDSLTGLFKALRTRPRSVSYLAGPSAGTQFHQSALDRQRDPPIAQPDYWPTRKLGIGKSYSLDIYSAEIWNTTGLFMKAGERYRMTARGKWLDSSIKCGPGGTADGNFQPAEIIHMGASALGGLESLFKRWTGNEDADFWFTRREEEMPWFSLVGVVANGNGTTDDGSAVKHECFLIGDKCNFTPTHDGYLYCFANDAWKAYGNNRGHVRLVIKRMA